MLRLIIPIFSYNLSKAVTLLKEKSSSPVIGLKSHCKSCVILRFSVALSAINRPPSLKHLIF